MSSDDSSDSDIFVETVIKKDNNIEKSSCHSSEKNSSNHDSKSSSSKEKLSVHGSKSNSSNHDKKLSSSSNSKSSSSNSKSSSSNSKSNNLKSVSRSNSCEVKASSSKSMIDDKKSEHIVEEISQIEIELVNVDHQIQNFKRKKAILQERHTKLTDELMMQKSNKLLDKDWSTTNFEWSKRLQELLVNVFNIPEFRYLQLSAINATLSKQDLILVMPTGGGKSLCYQLPALISPDLTLVISPLVSLMEDQIMQLKRRGINAEMMTATTKREDNTRIKKSITDGKDHEKTKLLYVAPEKLAKNKGFMSFLQKLYQNNGLARIAIDEVHCCSDWGHDFRPDYTFLGILRDMFSDVPIIGLTATASNKVITDTQKILSLQGCLVLKAPFNRPNLYYEVRAKTSVQSDWLNEVEDLLKTKFKDQSGIIYALSIKDTEELASELRKKGIKARWYHAMMPMELRSKAHAQWLSGQVQVIVATTAFGLGIDKPNVRFVIHHTLSKSIETYYQESGRAGRDGKPASCIIYYRFADYFRLSTLVFTQQTGLNKLSHMLAYCIEPSKCRRDLQSQHFSDNYDVADCNSMCDHCSKPISSDERDVTEHCINVYKIIENALTQETKLTLNMLFDLWYGKGKAALRVTNVPIPTSSRHKMERVVAHLIITNFLKEDFNYTAYSTISYLKIDNHGRTLLDSGYRIKMNVEGIKRSSSFEQTSQAKKYKS